MTDPHHDLDDLTARLRQERPDMSDDAFARVHDRVVARAPQRRRTPRTSIATALLVAVGLLFTGGGVSLAVSGLASDTTAVKAQYGTPGVSVQGGVVSTPTTTTPTDDVAVQGETDSTDPSLGGTAGEQDQQEPAAAPQQVVAASGGDTLPFTGFAAIPIVAIGAMLIAAGALLRRRTQA